MKKFVSLHFRPLPFVALFNFFVRFKGLLAAAGEAVLEAVAALMLDLNIWMTRGQAVLDWLARSAATLRLPLLGRVKCTGKFGLAHIQEYDCNGAVVNPKYATYEKADCAECIPAWATHGCCDYAQEAGNCEAKCRSMGGCCSSLTGYWGTCYCTCP
jgi:hypothetical protein